MKQVHVAVGVILRGQDVFICKRPETTHQGGKWEFPGGKVDSGETLSQALTRELAEEIGIQVTAHHPLMLIEHDYGDKHVKLDVHVVTHFDGEPFGKEGQANRWCPIADLNPPNFPDANVVIIDKLKEKY